MISILDLIPPGLRPYAKAVTPAFLAVIATIIRATTTGHLDAPELEVTVVGLLAASITFGVDNIPVGWRAYAKSIVPAGLTIAAVLVHYLVTGSWDQAEWTLAVTGLGSAFIALLVPNEIIHTIAAAVTATHLDAPATDAPVPLLPGETADGLAKAREGASYLKPPTRPA